MAGNLNIEAVSGTSPSWVLTVDSTTGVQVGDHLAGYVNSELGVGAVWRVTDVPDGVTINVEDDLGTGVYGQPEIETVAGFYTPTAALSLSQMHYDCPAWHTVLKRDLYELDVPARGRTELVDTDGLTADQVDATRVWVLESGTAWTQAAVVSTVSENYDLSGNADWGLRVETETANYDLHILSSAFGIPSAVPAADLATELQAQADLAGAGVTFSGAGGVVTVTRDEWGASYTVQIGTYAGVGSDLQTLLTFPLTQETGVDGVLLAVPAPTDTSDYGLDLVLVCRKGSESVRYSLQGQTGVLFLAEDTALTVYWDGAAWVS